MSIDWRELKYQIADKLFNYELDDAYRMGLQAGSEFATRKLSFALEMKADAIKMTPTEKRGYDRALEVFKEERINVEISSGLR